MCLNILKNCDIQNKNAYIYISKIVCYSIAYELYTWNINKRNTRFHLIYIQQIPRYLQDGDDNSKVH